MDLNVVYSVYENIPESRNICSSSVKVLKDAGFSTSCAIHLDEANALQADEINIMGVDWMYLVAPTVVLTRRVFVAERRTFSMIIQSKVLGQ